MKDLGRRLDAIEGFAGRRSAAPGPAPLFLDPAFLEQSAFISDPAKLKVLFCTRRSGKSFGDGRYLLKEAFETPSVSCLYLAMTRDSAENIMWRDVLRRLNRELSLEASPNKTKLELTLPNESTVRLLGMDADEDEKRKVLGGKYKLVVIDEAARWRTNLRSLVYEYIKPAVADYRGTIVLSSTSSELQAGLFFELTTGQTCQPHRWSREGWSGHAWNWRQNPYMRQQIEGEIGELEAANPLIRSTPSFRRNYDPGEWVIDESNLVYRYRVGRNDFSGTLPSYPRGEWHFVLAIDLGYTDATSFTVLAYHDHDRTLYVLKSEKRPGLDLTSVAEHAAQLKLRWPVEHTTIDGSAKQAVEELNRRLGLQATPADKREKAEHIDIMNDEFVQERIKLGPDTEPLKEEYAQLVWDERKLEQRKRVEHPACENHCTDGTLYGWRWSWQYLSEPLKKPAPRPGSPEFQQQTQAAVQQTYEAEESAEFRRNREESRGESERLPGAPDDWV